MKVYEILEQLSKCDPNIDVVTPDTDRDSGPDLLYNPITVVSLERLWHGQQDWADGVDVFTASDYYRTHYLRDSAKHDSVVVLDILVGAEDA